MQGGTLSIGFNILARDAVYFIYLQMKEKKTKHPGKVGKVGRKKAEEADKKQQITLYIPGKDIELLGGKEAVREKLTEHIKKEISNLPNI